MEIDDHDERYDSLAEYSKNYDIYKQIQGNNGDGYISFPKEIIPEDTEDKIYIVSNCLRLKNYLIKYNDKENCENNNCCGYINYMLNKSIKTLKKPHEPIFNFYISYINHYSNGQIKNLCASKINYMQVEKYKKTDQLYNAYEICRLFMANKHDTSTCSLAKSCANLYNNIFITHLELNDVKFCKALKNFKDVLESYKLKSKIKCSGEYLNLMSYPESCTLLLQKSEQLVVSSGYQAGQTETQIESEGPSGLQEDQMVEIQEDYTKRK
ncbi:PIR Superfamily Protein, partial [Plasmodium ovale curtisi]